MYRCSILTLALLCGSANVRAETPPPVLALKGLDPVALVAGNESPGLDSIEAEFGRFKYRFANEANKKAFLAKPQQHAIQFGGACGKMGPFSGTGSPDRYFIHDKRLYIFASEFCRDAFKKEPEKYIERPNPVPPGTDDEKKRGAILITKAVEGFGGEKVVDAVKTLQRIEKIVYKQGEKATIGTGRATWVFPDRLRIEEDYGTPYGHVVARDGGFELYGKKNWTLEPAMRDDAWRRALREPLVMLRNRTAKGFTAVARGENSVDVALDGATSTWTIDKKTGRIVKTEFKTRRGTVGNAAIAYSDFKELNGLVIPHTRIEFFNGKEQTLPVKRIEKVVVNGDVNRELFLQPK